MLSARWWGIVSFLLYFSRKALVLLLSCGFVLRGGVDASIWVNTGALKHGAGTASPEAVHPTFRPGLIAVFHVVTTSVAVVRRNTHALDLSKCIARLCMSIGVDWALRVLRIVVPTVP